MRDRHGSSPVETQSLSWQEDVALGQHPGEVAEDPSGFLDPVGGHAAIKSGRPTFIMPRVWTACPKPGVGSVSAIRLTSQCRVNGRPGRQRRHDGPG